jgi:hypothetical protein
MNRETTGTTKIGESGRDTATLVRMLTEGKIMRKTRVLVAVTLAVGLAVLPAAAQETTAEPETQAEKDAQAANANNPLANTVSFNIQNYYSAELRWRTRSPSLRRKPWNTEPFRNWLSGKE